MQTLQAPHRATWDKITSLMNPEGDPFDRQHARGTSQRGQVYDNTAEQAAELLAGVLFGTATNANQKFARYRMEDDRLNDREDVALFLQNATDVVMGRFNSPDSMFSTAQHEKLLDYVYYGNMCGFVAEDMRHGPIFQSRPLNECLVAENQHGQVDTIYRWYRMAAHQALREFKDRTPAKIREKAADPEGAEEEFQILHCVEPRAERDPQRRDAANMPFTSTYVWVDEKELIRDGGFPEWPYQFSRWRKRARDPLGRGPGHKALPDTQSLQQTAKLQFRAWERSMLPPLQVADDGVVSRISLQGGALNVVRADLMQYPQGAIRPIQTGINVDAGNDALADQRQRIDNAFLRFLLQLFGDPRMTATQAVQISDEVLRILGPVLGRMQVEDLGPMMNRVFWICFRMGWFGPVPDAMKGQRIEVEYVSPMANAQRLSEVRAMAQGLDFAASLAQFDDTIGDNIDANAVFRRGWRLLGSPLDVLNDQRKVRGIRDARNDETRRQAEMEQGMQGGDMLSRLLPALASMNGGKEAA